MKVIIALIGKAGAGKDTILQILCRVHPEYNMIVSCTTRPKRENETEGFNYYFLSDDAFAEKVLNGDMLEVTEFNSWFYGTAESSLREGVNIGVFNPAGFESLREHDDIKVLGYYIAATPKTRLLRQLNREQAPDVNEIIRRYKVDEEDFIDLEYIVDSVCINEDEQDLQDIVREIERDIQDLGVVG